MVFDKIKQKIYRDMANALQLELRTSLSSDTVAKGSVIKLHSKGFQVIWPHFWVVYWEKGRGPIRAIGKKRLVFFAKDYRHLDPRLKDGYPVRPNQIKRLTKGQFREFLEMNRDRERMGRPPVMYIAASVGPFGGTGEIEATIKKWQRTKGIGILKRGFLRVFDRQKELILGASSAGTKITLR